MVSSIGSLSLKKDKTANRRGQASGNGDLLALLLPVISLSPAVSVWYRPPAFWTGSLLQRAAPGVHVCWFMRGLLLLFV